MEVVEARQGKSKRRNIHEKQHRSSHRSCSVKKGVFKNFADFTGKTCVGVSF